ncbi:MAG: hypothetical protein ACI841_001937 [Planctomycetota bacterium]|jgi:hypothetical protein
MNLQFCAIGTPLALVFVSLTAAPTFAIEVDAPCSNSAVHMSYGERAVCTISSGTENDVYKFHGLAGDVVRVIIDGRTNDFDPMLRLIGPTGGSYASVNCSAPSWDSCSTGSTWELVNDGLYTLLVSDAGSNNSGNYTLDLQVLPPQVHVPILEYGVTRTVTINHGSDSDWYRFDGMRGEMVILTIDGLTNNLDPRIQVMDPLGNRWWQDVTCSAPSWDTCSSGTGMVFLPEDGTYYVTCFDSGWNNTGSFHLNLTCVLGTCPTTTAPVDLGTPFCTAAPNSTGAEASIEVWGIADVASNSVEVIAKDVPAGQWGIVFMGATPSTAIPIIGSQGSLCLSQATPIVRLSTILSSNSNQMRRFLDLDSSLLANQILPGNTWHFQAWFRDQNPGSTTNTSNGTSVLFQ